MIFMIFFHVTLKSLNFHMDVLSNHMSSDIYKVTYQYFWPKA
jgi:hypothetical protein